MWLIHKKLTSIQKFIFNFQLAKVLSLPKIWINHNPVSNRVTYVTAFESEIMNLKSLQMSDFYIVYQYFM